MIAWTYINKQEATIAVLKDYYCMQKIIGVTPEYIKNHYNTQSAQPNQDIADQNENNGHHNIYLNKTNLLQKRYLQAKEYMEWVAPAWGCLNKIEQQILKEYYFNKDGRSGAPVRLSIDLNYSERHIQRLRQTSLEKLALLLFGK